VYVDGSCVVRDRRLVRAEWSDIRRQGEVAADSLWSARPR
jgi:hypothetical protein